MKPSGVDGDAKRILRVKFADKSMAHYGFYIFNKESGQNRRKRQPFMGLKSQKQNIIWAYIIAIQSFPNTCLLILSTSGVIIVTRR